MNWEQLLSTDRADAAECADLIREIRGQQLQLYFFCGFWGYVAPTPRRESEAVSFQEFPEGFAFR